MIKLYHIKIEKFKNKTPKPIPTPYPFTPITFSVSFFSDSCSRTKNNYCQSWKKEGVRHRLHMPAEIYPNHSLYYEYGVYSPCNYACCDKAVKNPCDCMYSTTCPDHGIRCGRSDPCSNSIK